MIVTFSLIINVIQAGLWSKKTVKAILDKASGFDKATKDMMKAYKKAFNIVMPLKWKELTFIDQETDEHYKANDIELICQILIYMENPENFNKVFKQQPDLPNELLNVSEDVYLQLKDEFEKEIANTESIAFIIQELIKLSKVILSLNNVVQKIEIELQNSTITEPIQTVDQILESFKDASLALSSIPNEINKITLCRNETKDLLSWIANPVSSNNKEICLLIGKAGYGKSVILRELYEALLSQKMPVFALKADMKEAICLNELSQILGFKTSIKSVIQMAQKYFEKVIVIIDQIDALSQYMSKDRKFLNCYLELILQLSSMKNVRLVISCREFDLAYDRSLNSIKFDKKIKVGLLGDEEINQVLKVFNTSLTDLYPKIQKIIKVPNNLYLFCKVFQYRIDLKKIKTPYNLFNELWKNEIVINKDRNVSNRKPELLYRLANEITKKSALCLTRSPYFDEYDYEINELASDGILKCEYNKLSFYHSSFYDYCFARSFIKDNKSLMNYILSTDQGLFIRSQIKLLIHYLRDVDSKRYFFEIEEIINSSEIKFHIKLLILEQIGYWDNLFTEEKQIILSAIKNDEILEIHFIDSLFSKQWLEYLVNNKIIENWLNSGNENLINHVNNKLMGLINNYPDLIIKVLKLYPNVENKEIEILKIIYYLDNWENSEYFQMVKPLLSNPKNYNSRTSGYLLKKISKYKQIETAKLLFTHINLRIGQIKKNAIEREILNYEEFDILEYLITHKKSQKYVIRNSLKSFNLLINKTHWADKTGLINDRIFDHRYHYKDFLYKHWHWLSMIENELQNIAQIDSKYFEDLILNLTETKSITLLELLLKCYLKNIPCYINNIYSLITKKYILKSYGMLSYYVKKSIHETFNYLDSEKQKTFLEIITSLTDDRETDLLKNCINRRRTAKMQKVGYSYYNPVGRVKHELLSSIPSSYINNNLWIKKTLDELNRKLGNYKILKPKPGESGTVTAPLENIAYQKMSKMQWYNSMLKFDETYDSFSSRRGFLKGGMIEHSRAFGNVVQKNPDMYYDFIIDIGRDDIINMQYFAEGIRGLVSSNIEDKKLYSLVLEFYKMKHRYIRNQMISVIDKLLKVNEKEELINILNYYLNSKTDEVEESWENGNYGSSPLTSGINSIRGSAAWSLSQNTFTTKFPELIFSIFEKIASDVSVSLRCCLMSSLHGLINHDKERTLKLLFALTSDNNKHVISNSIFSIYYLMNEYFDELKSKILIITQKESTLVNNLGKNLGNLLMSAYWWELNDSQALLINSCENNLEVTKGVIEASSKHLNNPDQVIAKKSVEVFSLFFHLDDKDISSTYDWCFHDIDVNSFNDNYELFREYSNTTLITYNSTHFLKYLLKVTPTDPDNVFVLIKDYKRYEKPDLSYNALNKELVEIIINIYNYSKSKTIKNDTINIFDEIMQDDNYKFRAMQAISDSDRL